MYSLHKQKFEKDEYNFLVFSEKVFLCISYITFPLFECHSVWLGLSELKCALPTVSIMNRNLLQGFHDRRSSGIVHGVDR